MHRCTHQHILFTAVFLSGNTSTSQMDEKQDLPPAYNEATEGYPGTGNPGFAGDSFGYPSSYPPQQGYGEGYAAQPGYQPTQKNYKSNHSTVDMNTSGRRSRRKKFQDPIYLAIFTTICCFWPIGIFAIFRASEARTARATGYFEPAQTLSRESRRLSLIGIGIGCIGIVITIVVVFAVNKIAVNTANYYLSQLNHEAK